MKKSILTSLVAIIAATAVFASDTSITVSTAQDVNLVLSPNGSLGGTPAWSMTGVGSLVPSGDAKSAKVITGGAGTNVVTATVLAGGVTLTSKVTILVISPPATDMVIVATAVPK